MKLNGYSISEENIIHAKIAKLGNYSYLDLSLFNDSTKFSHSLQFYKLQPNELDNILTHLFSVFKIDSLEQISSKKVFCLASDSHVLCLINPDNFETFSLNSILEKDKIWINKELTIHHALQKSKLPFEQIVNLSFIKTSLENKKTLTPLDNKVLTRIEHIILINKLDIELVQNDNNHSKFKI